MTLRNLQVFVKVAECGKMSTAAKQLFVSQSSVSQSVSEIEKKYNVVLFNRVGKQLSITPIGKQLLEYARKAVAYQDSIVEWLTQNLHHKHLRAGATITVGATVFSPILSIVEERCPDIDIFAYVGNTDAIVEKLLSGELDIALVEGNVTNSHIESRVVMDDHLVLACGRKHRFFGRSSVSIKELEGEKFLLREHGSGTRAQILQILEEYGIGYAESWECNSFDSIKCGVSDGHGISVMSERLIQNECRAGLLWPCTIEEFPICRHFSLVSYHNKIHTDTMTMFEEAVAELERREISIKL